MSRASPDIMDMLHGLVATGISEELSRAIKAAAEPRTITDGEGNVTDNPAYAPINPQLIDKALKFLKDNGVDAPASAPRVNHLASQLADLDLDDEAYRLRTN